MIYDKTFDGKWQDNEKRCCKLVFIGKNLELEQIKKDILECKAKDLRFPIGTKVECNLGNKWVKGEIV